MGNVSSSADRAGALAEAEAIGADFIVGVGRSVGVELAVGAETGDDAVVAGVLCGGVT